MKGFASFLLSFALAACTSRTIEVSSIRFRPVNVDVEVEAFSPPLKDRGDSAYAVTVRILDERGDGVSKARLVVSDITNDAEPFLAAGSRWRIHADEEMFEQQKAVGFSFWTLHDLRPAPEVDPIHWTGEP